MLKKYLTLIILALCLPAVVVLAQSTANPDFNDQDDLNTDDLCGTASADCEWTFELLCPAEVVCDGDVDLGVFCIGDIIRPTGDDSWIVFRIGGEARRYFHITVDVDENAIDEDGNYVDGISVNSLVWQYTISGRNGILWRNISSLSGLDLVNEPECGMKMSSYDTDQGECISPDDDRAFMLRVRPVSIITQGAEESGNYAVRISLGVDFGYNL